MENSRRPVNSPRPQNAERDARKLPQGPLPFAPVTHERIAGLHVNRDLRQRYIAKLERIPRDRVEEICQRDHKAARQRVVELTREIAQLRRAA